MDEKGEKGFEENLEDINAGRGVLEFSHRTFSWAATQTRQANPIPASA